MKVQLTSIDLLNCIRTQIRVTICYNSLGFQKEKKTLKQICRMKNKSSKDLSFNDVHINHRLGKTYA